MLAATFAWFLHRVAAPGPDLQNYAEWGEAALTRDIFRISGTTLSPMGVPASVWAPGAGLILSVLGADAGILVAWLVALLFWWSMTRLIAAAARGRIEWIVLGTGLAFVATHAGYYSTVHATESLALALIATLATTAAWQGPARAVDGWTVGVAGGLVVLTRPQLAPYVGLAWALLVARGWRAGHLKSVRWWVASTGPAVLFVGVAALLLAFVNRWMTGSPLHSPWMFGAASFSSVDFADPEWLAVLAHPWHGLLVYHPLYGVALVALIAGIVERPATALRRAIGVCLLAVILSQVFLQAAWFCWWMGTDTFGMRGLAVSAVVLIPVLVDRMALDEDRGRSAAGWLLLSLVAALWSFLLLLRNDSNFFSYEMLLGAQTATLQRWTLPLAGGLAVAAGIAALDRRPRGAALAVGSTLWALAFLYLAQRLWIGVRQLPSLPLTGVAIGLVVAVHLLLRRVSCDARRMPRADGVLTVALTVAFAVCVMRFSALAARTEEVIRLGQQPPRAFDHVATVPLQAIEASYREYLRVPGFERRKRALAGYLAEASANPAPVRSRSARPSSPPGGRDDDGPARSPGGSAPPSLPAR